MNLERMIPLLCLWVAAGCPSADSLGERESGATPVAEVAQGEGSSWLRGDTDARFALVEKHLRGFDVAMMETGYRYGELYWAGQDRNWAYASYQLQKIETAIANGVQRRPRRAASAQMMEGAVASVRSAIEAADPTAFDEAFGTLTKTCNLCHAAERVPFVDVVVPTERLSPVRAPTPVPAPEERGE